MSYFQFSSTNLPYRDVERGKMIRTFDNKEVNGPMIRQPAFAFAIAFIVTSLPFWVLWIQQPKGGPPIVFLICALAMDIIGAIGLGIAWLVAGPEQISGTEKTT